MISFFFTFDVSSFVKYGVVIGYWFFPLCFVHIFLFPSSIPATILPHTTQTILNVGAHINNHTSVDDKKTPWLLRYGN